MLSNSETFMSLPKLPTALGWLLGDILPSALVVSSIHGEKAFADVIVPECEFLQVISAVHPGKSNLSVESDNDGPARQFSHSFPVQRGHQETLEGLANLCGDAFFRLHNGAGVLSIGPKGAAASAPRSSMGVRLARTYLKMAAPAPKFFISKWTKGRAGCSGLEGWL